MADSRSSKEGSAEGGHGTATGSSSPTDDSSHSTPSKVVLIIIVTLLNNMSIKSTVWVHFHIYQNAFINCDLQDSPGTSDKNEAAVPAVASVTEKMAFTSLASQG